MIEFSNGLNLFRTSSQSFMRSAERISSGSQLNRASDNPAGVAISNRMNAASRGNEVATRNVTDALSMTQVADSGLSSMSKILTRMRELAVAASSDTLSNNDKLTLQKEFGSLREEIQHISTQTNYNGSQLLDNNGTVSVQASSEASDTINVNAVDVQTGASGLSINTLDISTDPNNAIKAIDSAIEKVSSTRSEYGSMMNRFEEVIDNLHEKNIALEAAESRVIDADLIKEISNMTQMSILQKASIAMISHSNQNKEYVINLLK